MPVRRRKIQKKSYEQDTHIKPAPRSSPVAYVPIPAMHAMHAEAPEEKKQSDPPQSDICQLQIVRSRLAWSDRSLVVTGEDLACRSSPRLSASRAASHLWPLRICRACCVGTRRSLRLVTVLWVPSPSTKMLFGFPGTLLTRLILRTMPSPCVSNQTH